MSFKVLNSLLIGVKPRLLSKQSAIVISSATATSTRSTSSSSCTPGLIISCSAINKNLRHKLCALRTNSNLKVQLSCHRNFRSSTQCLMSDPWRGEKQKLDEESEAEKKRSTKNPFRDGVSSDLMCKLSNNYSDEDIENYIKNRLRNSLISKQSFSAERIAVLGPDVAVARFVVFMDGKVKIHGIDEWFSKHNIRNHPLPTEKVHNFKVEAIDLSNSAMMLEGIENLWQVKSLHHLSLANCEFLDSHSIAHLVHLPDSIVSLDLSGNEYITERCLIPLFNLPNLRKLDLGGIPYFRNQPLALLMLEELMPECVIVNVEFDNPTASTDS